MPKIILNLEETIIQKAREILFKEGYNSLSMRRMANECNIAVGTIYNYVNDKSELIAKVALSDWFKTVQKIVDINDDETSFIDGVMNIYKNVRIFNQMYKGYWTSVPMPHRSVFDSLDQYHPIFRIEVQKMILPLMNNDDGDNNECISKMLAELIISLVIHSEDNENDLRLFIENLNK